MTSSDRIFDDRGHHGFEEDSVLLAERSLTYTDPHLKVSGLIYV